MIGYYVHHHGSGHLARAGALARATARPVTVLSSLPRPDVIAPFADWVELPRDDDTAYGDAADGDTVDGGDPTANGALHWVPLGSPGLRARGAALSGWFEAARPAALVVDVSVEVALLARLHGVATIVVAQPGERTDAPHRLVYRLATAVLAPWPAEVLQPPHLADAPVTYTGAMSRFDGLPRAPAQPGSVLVLLGTGGDAVGPADVRALAEACPDRTVRAVGGSFGWEPDLWPALCAAAVVVTHAGLNAVAEVAAARRPAVVVAAVRPFDEQVRTAAALDDAAIAVGLASWPDARRWPHLLRDAEERGGSGWKAWNDLDGAARAVRVIEEVATGD